MRIIKLECLHADAGFRNFDFLKITTDEGVVGWSEYNESFGGMGVSAVIDNLAPTVVGQDPRPRFPGEHPLFFCMEMTNNHHARQLMSGVIPRRRVKRPR